MKTSSGKLLYLLKKSALFFKSSQKVEDIYRSRQVVQRGERDRECAEFRFKEQVVEEGVGAGEIKGKEKTYLYTLQFKSWRLPLVFFF